MDIKLNKLNKTIINCKKCPRLVQFIKKISTEKRKQNINEIYWGKPVPGFGNFESKLAIIEVQELEGLLQEINQEIFCSNACMRLGFQIIQFQKM